MKFSISPVLTVVLFLLSSVLFAQTNLSLSIRTNCENYTADVDIHNLMSLQQSTQTLDISSNYRNIQDIVWADIDGDDIKDLIVSAGYYWKGPIEENTSPSPIQINGYSNTDNGFQVVDIDNNGTLDLIPDNILYNNKVHYYANDGQANFTRTTIPISIPAVSGVNGTVGDLDNDGRTDILVSCPYNYDTNDNKKPLVRLEYENGNWVKETQLLDVLLYEMKIIHLNESTTPQIVAGTDYQPTLVFLENFTATPQFLFQKQEIHREDLITDIKFINVRQSELKDIVFTHTVVDSFFVSRINQTTDLQFQSTTLHKQRGYQRCLEIGDIDADGDEDICFTVHDDSYGLQVLTQQEDAAFYLRPFYQTFGYPYALSLFDLDQNGHLDILAGYRSVQIIYQTFPYDFPLHLNYTINGNVQTQSIDYPNIDGSIDFRLENLPPENNVLTVQDMQDNSATTLNLDLERDFILNDPQAMVSIRTDEIIFQSGDYDNRLFKNVPANQSTIRNIFIENNGTKPLHIRSIHLSNSSRFTIQTPPTETVNAGESTTIEIAYTPDCEDRSTATLQLSTNACATNDFELYLIGNTQTEITITTQKSCTNENTGQLAATIIGTGNYTYQWSNNATTPTIENLAAGTYTLTVTDNTSNCTYERTAEVLATPNPLTTNYQFTIPDTCNEEAVMNFTHLRTGQLEKSILTTSADGAREIVSGDFNNDGRLDVIGVAQERNQIYWYKNTGNDPEDYSERRLITETGVRTLLVVDIDEDNDLDIITANAFGELLLFETLDNTGFYPAFNRRVLQTGLPALRSLEYADYNHDGRKDLLVSLFDSGEIIVLTNTNDSAIPTFDKTVIDTELAGARSASFVDLNGDDAVDILAAGWNSGEVVWYENNANSFTRHVIASDFNQPSSVMAADIDGDLDLDIAVTVSEGGKLLWYENTTGNFSTLTEHLVSDNVDDVTGASHVQVVDFDLDGDQDLLVTAFAAGTLILFDNVTANTLNFQPKILDNNITGAHRVHLADLDGNGYLDPIVAVYTNNCFVLYFQHPNYQPNAALNFTLDGHSQTVPFTVNADGTTQIPLSDLNSGSHTVTLQSIVDGNNCTYPLTDEVEFYLFDPAVDFTIKYNGAAIEPLTAAEPSKIDYGLVEAGDSKALVFTIENNGTAPLDLSRANAFQTTGSPAFTITPPSQNEIPAGGSATFNIVFQPECHRAATAMVGVLTNDCNRPTFEFPVQGQTTQLEFTATIEPTCPAGNMGSIQINAPADYQFIWENGATTSRIDELSFGSYTVSVSDPEGRCTIVENYNVREVFSPDLTRVKVTAVDACSDDLLRVELNHLPQNIYRLDSLHTSPFFEEPETPYSLDIDQDGDSDLLVPVRGEGVFYIKNTPERVDPIPVYLVSNYWRSLILADLDQDGLSDLLMFFGDGRRPVWIRNNGDETFTTQFLEGTNNETPPAQPQVIDLNQDGQMDIITNYAGQLHFNRGLANGEFSSEIIELPVEQAANDYYAFHDIDNDGDLDLVKSNYSNPTIYVLENLGNLTFTADEYPMGNYYNDRHRPIFINMDNDPELEFVFLDDRGLWVNNISADFEFTSTNFAINISGYQNHVFYDADQDGDQDLYMSVHDNSTSAFQYRLFENENSVFSASTIVFAPAKQRHLVLGHFNSDQEIDLLDMIRERVLIEGFYRNRSQLIAQQVEKSLPFPATIQYENALETSTHADLIAVNDTIAYFDITTPPTGSATFNTLQIVSSEHCNLPLEHTFSTYINNANATFSLNYQSQNIPNQAAASPQYGTDFNSITGSDSQSRTFTITNSGTEDVVIKQPIESSNPTHFQITQPANFTIAPNSNADFTIEFTPNCIPDTSAVITILNDDCTEAIFTFTVRGGSDLAQLTTQIDTTCVNELNGNIDLTVIPPTNNPNATFNYYWEKIGSDFTTATEDIVQADTGRYVVQITDAATNCIVEDTFTIEHFFVPDLSNIAIDAPSVCEGEEFVATFSGLPKLNFVNQITDNFYSSDYHRFVDIDGDGDTDVFYNDYSQKTLYLSDNGSLPVEGTAMTGLSNLSVSDVYAFGEINGDGRLDILTAIYQSGRHVFGWYFHGEDAAFTQINTNIEIGDRCHFASADMDNDGDWDVVISDWDFNVIRLLINDGAQNFTEQTLSILPNNPFRYDAPQLIDLDGDQLKDILVASPNAGLKILRNGENLQFTNYSIGEVPSQLDDVLPYDYDNDGDMDITISYNDNIRIYEQADDAFTYYNLEVQEADNYPGTLRWTDLNNDGVLELITRGNFREMLVFQQQGMQQFTQTVLFEQGFYNYFVEDIDNDGQVDVVSSFEPTRFYWFKNVSPPNFPHTYRYQFNEESPLDFVIENTSATGSYAFTEEDLAAGHYELSLLDLTDDNHCVYPIDSTVAFDVKYNDIPFTVTYNNQTISNNLNTNYTYPTELIGAYIGETVERQIMVHNHSDVPLYLSSSGTSSSYRRFTLRIPPNMVVAPGESEPLTIEFSHDSCYKSYTSEDLKFITNSCSTTEFNFKVGLETYKPEIAITTELTCEGAADGSLTAKFVGPLSYVPTNYELIWEDGNTSTTATTAILANVPAGAYRIAIQRSNNLFCSTEYETAIVKSFIQPQMGDLDILVTDRCFANEAELVVKTPPIGSFTQRPILDDLEQIDDFKVMDVNRDGHTDILIRYKYYDLNMYWLENDGFGNFGHPTLLLNEPHSRFQAHHVTDFDADGYTDILAAYEDTVRIYKGTADPLIYQIENLTTNSGNIGPHVIETADFNGDGEQDFTLREFYDFTTLTFCLSQPDGSYECTLHNNILSTTSQQIIDFDQDNDLDVILLDRFGINWLVNNGTGQFSIRSFHLDFRNVKDYMIHDVDEDGDYDITLVDDHSNGGIYRLTNIGDFQFDSNRLYADNRNWTIFMGQFDNSPELEAVQINNFAEGAWIAEDKNGLWNATAISEQVFYPGFYARTNKKINLDNDPYQEIIVVSDWKLLIIDPYPQVDLPLSLTYSIEGNTPITITDNAPSLNGNYQIPIEDLATGSHSITVNSLSFGRCPSDLSTTEMFTLNSSPAYEIVSTNTCENEEAGSIQIETSGTYNFQWENENYSGTSLQNLVADTYQFTISNDDCTKQDSVVIGGLNIPTWENTTIELADNYCADEPVVLNIENVDLSLFDRMILLHYRINGVEHQQEPIANYHPEVSSQNLAFNIAENNIQTGENQIEILGFSNFHDCFTPYEGQILTFTRSNKTAQLAVEWQREAETSVLNHNDYVLMTNYDIRFPLSASLMIKNPTDYPLSFSTIELLDDTYFSIDPASITTIPAQGAANLTISYTNETPDEHYTLLLLHSDDCAQPEFILRIGGQWRNPLSNAEQLNFQATKNENAVQLTWSFQRATSGIYQLQHRNEQSEWSNIYNNNFDANIQKGQFKHQNPTTGINYYRLALTAADGTVTYSPIRVLRFVRDQLLTYPNPTSGKVKLVLPTEEQDAPVTQVMVYSALGQLVKQQPLALDGQVDLQTLASGTYQIIVQRATERWMTRIVIVKE